MSKRSILLLVAILLFVFACTKSSRIGVVNGENNLALDTTSLNEKQVSPGVVFAVALMSDSAGFESRSDIYMMHDDGQLWTQKDFCNYLGASLCYPEALKESRAQGTINYDLHFDFGRLTESKFISGFEQSELIQKEMEKQFRKFSANLKLLQDKHVILHCSVEVRLI